MLIVYASSMVGNTRSFAEKLDMGAVDIDGIIEVTEPYILITSTVGQGEVPNKVKEFLKNESNKNYLRGVASSGNRVFQSNYGKSADIISQSFEVPIVLKFELKGAKGDIKRFKERVHDLYELHRFK